MELCVYDIKVLKLTYGEVYLSSIVILCEKIKQFEFHRNVSVCMKVLYNKKGVPQIPCVPVSQVVVVSVCM